MSRRRKKTPIVLTLQFKEPWKVKKGHTDHISGSGQHLDRRTKRKRTRASQLKDALNEYREIE